MEESTGKVTAKVQFSFLTMIVSAVTAALLMYLNVMRQDVSPFAWGWPWVYPNPDGFTDMMDKASPTILMFNIVFCTLVVVFNAIVSELLYRRLKSR